ncbi:hypothetical protein PRUPE_2G132200 [Prunus persica]|uniref:RWD domain-containing protein n=2 Tax=Prunus persica TaxID=3760 RepID=M5X1J9_PRUPE|nr:uncharacterized protein LOC18786673 [Prunus persica]ONI22480.1 hypothetical protein PRUPE_2G132200 [Prunus persica]
MADAAAQEEEVAAEVEAVQAVYGDDCVVLESYPPHLHLYIKPRTADVASQQFVEAVIGVRAGSQYPNEPPHIELLDSKGLDFQRQKHLTNSIRDRACDLSSCLMLVAICEEAVEKLSVMNHPDGDCPLCLYPLVPEDEQSKVLPFMKLMSCFHCFHSECIIRWWNWIQTEERSNASDSSSAHVPPIRDLRNHKDTRGAVEESMGNCPVCRKVFHAEDFEHVLNLVGNHSSHLSLNDNEDDDGEKLLQSESENARRQNFEALLKSQQENSGLIEPKKNIVVLPGMLLPPPVASSTSETAKESAEEQQREPPVTSEMHSGGSSDRHSGGSSDGPNTHEQRSSTSRERRVRNTRRPVKQWIKKESGRAE